MSYHIQLDQIGATYIANSAMHTQAKPAHRREAPKFDHAPFGMPNGTLDRVSRGRKLSVCRRGLAYVSHRASARAPAEQRANQSKSSGPPTCSGLRPPPGRASRFGRGRAWCPIGKPRQASSSSPDGLRGGCLRDRAGSPGRRNDEPTRLKKARREGPRSARRRRRDGSEVRARKGILPVELRTSRKAAPPNAGRPYFAGAADGADAGVAPLANRQRSSPISKNVDVAETHGLPSLSLLSIHPSKG